MLASTRPVCAQSSSGANDLVWTMRGLCANPHRVRLSLEYRHTVVYRTIVGLCQGSRTTLRPEPEERIRRFSFLGIPHDFAPALGEQSHQIDARLWEVLAGTDTTTLGVAFFRDGQVLLNATHAVGPTTATRNTLAPSLTIATEPLPTER